MPKRLPTPNNPRFSKPGAGNSNTLPSRPKVNSETNFLRTCSLYLLQIPAKPVISPRTVEPKTIEELLELHNATKYVDVLMDAGYDDIKYICETDDGELEDIGIVNSTDRQQVIIIQIFF